MKFHLMPFGDGRDNVHEFFSMLGLMFTIMCLAYFLIFPNWIPIRLLLLTVPIWLIPMNTNWFKEKFTTSTDNSAAQ